MADIIQFQRYQDVTGWSLYRIRDWLKAHKWNGFVLHWKGGEEVILERRA